MPACLFSGDRPGPEPPRQLGGLLVASSLLLFTDSVRTRLVPWLVSYAVGALLGVALLALLPEALALLPPSRCSDAPRRHHRVLPARKAGAAAPLPHRRVPRARRRRTARDHRRRLSQFHRRRDHLHGGPDVGAARRQHRDRRRRARNSAGSRRRRHPARRRLQPAAGAAPESRRRRLSGLAGALLAYGTVELRPGVRPFLLAFSSASLMYIAMSDLIPDLHRGAVDRERAAPGRADRRRHRHRRALRAADRLRWHGQDQSRHRREDVAARSRSGDHLPASRRPRDATPSARTS